MLVVRYLGQQVEYTAIWWFNCVPGQEKAHGAAAAAAAVPEVGAELTPADVAAVVVSLAIEKDVQSGLDRLNSSYPWRRFEIMANIYHLHYFLGYSHYHWKETLTDGCVHFHFVSVEEDCPFQCPQWLSATIAGCCCPKVGHTTTEAASQMAY